ncbi:hypothetical protein [Streptomyces sp. PTD5-9]|uniref:hypothetical protein n=1 Tax=Streptomyces sp. PTD5-9 TaxID=3120150 RepID=UPI0030086006
MPEDLAPRPQDPAGTERLIRIGALYLRYLRDGHLAEDAREMALTLALWAGSQLAALMLDDPERISAYLNARDHTAPQPPSS